MKPLLSLIIPFYNADSVIDNCLNSLENQTSNNFEVIFVDDASNFQNLKNLKDKLKNVTFSYQILSNKKNSGPGITRNNGILNANYPYITFVDSDDYIDIDFVKKVESTVLNNDADIVIFDYYLVDAEQKQIGKSLLLNDDIVDTKDALALSNGMCWGKVYKKELIAKYKIEFPNLIRSEDLAFVKIYLSKCRSVYYFKEPLYYYVKNNNSIMHRKDTLDINNNIEAFKYIQKNISKSDALEMIFIREYLYLVVQIMILKEYKNSDIKKFIDDSNLMYPNWKDNKYIKYQPAYLKILLFFLRLKMILPMRIAFLLKK